MKNIDVNTVDYVQEWLQRTIAKVDALLMQVCRKFEAEKYKVVSQCGMSDVICLCCLMEVDRSGCQIDFSHLQPVNASYEFWVTHVAHKKFIYL